MYFSTGYPRGHTAVHRRHLQGSQGPASPCRRILSGKVSRWFLEVLKNSKLKVLHVRS